MAKEKVIEVANLVKRFGKKYALKGISFTVYRGEVFGLLGPNGSGKTTTLRAIAGALKPTKGKVVVLGVNSFEDPVTVKKVIGVVPELPSLFPELTVYDNLSFIAKLYDLPRTTIRERIKEVLELLDIASIADVRYGSLSKGLKRRVDIAAALIHDPQILLLDEPTSGLDVISASSLRQIIRDLSRLGKSIILSSHYIEEVMMLSNRVMILLKGSKIIEGTPDDLRRILGLGKKVRVYYKGVVEEEVFRKLASILEEKGIGRQLSYEPGVFEFMTSNVVESLEVVRSYLDKYNVSIVDLEVVPPSWEDVFRKHVEGFNKSTYESGRSTFCSCGCGG